MRRVFLTLIAGLFVILVGGWMLVAAPFFGGLRASVAQNWLDKNGAGVTLTGPLNLDLGKVTHVEAEGISLDAPGAVQLAKVEADVTLADLWQGKVDPANIVITGATASLVRDAEGNLVGKTSAQGAAKGAAPDPDAIFAALAGKTIRLVDTRVSLMDQVSNFAFDVQLATLDLQGDGGDGLTSLKGAGTVNGQPLDLSAAAGPDAPLTLTATSAATALSFTGAEGSKGLSALSGQIALQSSDISQTLKVLQLEPVLGGTANAHAILGQSAEGNLALTGIEVLAKLDTGQSAQISGVIGDLRNMDKADVAIDLRFYPVGQEPERAVLVKDLRLTSVHMALVGPLRGDTRRQMTISTNGFEINTAGVGPAPIQLSKISRGPQGELVVGRLAIQVGPVGAPWLDIQGQVGDLLTASGLALQGQVAFPLSTIGGAGSRKLPAELGSIDGQFKVSGNIHALALTDIKLATTATDLWTFGVSGAVATVAPLDGIDLKMDASFQTAAMLKALGREPIDIQPLEFHLVARSTDSAGTVAGKLSMQMAKSSVAVDLAANNRGQGPVIKGTVTSTLIRLEDLHDGLEAAAEIASALRNNAPKTASSKRPVTRSDPDRAQDDVQGITLELVDMDRLLRYGDINIAVKFADIAGKTQLKGVDAVLNVAKGKASLGPLKFAFDGGHFDLTATIDAIAAPKIVHLKGSSDGWSFGRVMKMMRVKVPATGIIDATFDLSGEYRSVADFLSTMTGSTTLRMRNGTIDSSLLDLAGLGVVPWLFSKDRHEKFANITCLRAPLEFKNGVVSTQEAVLETPAVQLVAYGSVNIPKRTINVAGQPRPIGKPLKRSPWPFTLSGSLTHPKVKVKDGPSRLRRVDGANKMPAKRVPCVPDILQLK